MVDEQGPPKRVVKRVVKKTVTRPAPADPAPTVRYGRPIATATPRAKVATRPGPKTTPAAKSAPRQKTARQKTPRRTIDVRGALGTVHRRTSTTWHTAAGTVGTGARAGSRFAGRRVRTAAAWRLPHLSPYPAAAITGAVVGIVSVLLGAGVLAAFTELRGVSSGGGLWGSIAFAAVVVVSGFLGESLLRGFGSRSPRLTSFWAVVLVIIAMLALFLERADSWTALILVPALGVVAYALSHWLIDLAESTPPVID